MIDYCEWLSVFAPFVLLCPPIDPFVLFAPLSLKINPKGAIQPTLRTTDTAQEVTGSLILYTSGS